MQDINIYFKNIDPSLLAETRRYYTDHPENITVEQELRKVVKRVYRDTYWICTTTTTSAVLSSAIYAPDNTVISYTDYLEEVKSVISEYYRNPSSFNLPPDVPPFNFLESELIEDTTTYTTIPDFGFGNPHYALDLSD
ncbi:hypothetical protein PGT21_050243 [Puccinia graminis f. sp. tritici]|uniref:Uncharacterized protein n=1 Tax=Puccinia graminis f. sp. tritici TaxID=56615 RepID=A0A5B0NP87_PUCGR|nr:hypothetical protein PGT21_050243 [Puccinia graminis f. sp. tritici]